MSAGICIMNRNAIAMAADSAVTIGDHAAVHNSANKLFSLSRIEPIGLIIYANATLMSVPVEIIVKSYKKKLGDKTFPKLQDYVSDFINYIESNADLFRFAINEKDYVFQIFADLVICMLGDYKNFQKSFEEKQGRKPDEAEITALGEKAVNTTIDFVDRMARRTDYSFSQYIKTKYLQLFVDAVKNDTNYNWLTDDQVKLVCEKACELYDTDFERNGYVGIAIAGYGETEIYPHMIHLHVSGFINGQLRYLVHETVEISEKNDASIAPLAQTDVMQTFLFGINDRFINDLAKEIPSQIQQTVDGMDDSCFAPGQKSLVTNQLNGVTGNILRHMTETAQKDYMLPIIQSVATLPIEELSLLAESMINITSLRRKVALDKNIGTVGGPIDVAIISKGDGFIWLKRKHYFDKKYNPQYMYSHFGNNRIKELGDDE